MKKKIVSDRLVDLSPTLQPKRDLWPGIEAAISTEKLPLREVKRDRKRLYLFAAAAALAITIGFSALAISRSIADVGSFAGLRGAELADMVDELIDAEKAYKQAKDRLIYRIAAVDAAYGGDLASELKDQFKAIDSQIDHAVAALKRDPGNADTAGRLLVLFDSQFRTISFTELLIDETE